MKWLVCLAGGIATGKTTLAEALQEVVPGSVRVAFGDVVRRRAQAAKLELTRENLQRTGLQLIAEGWPPFVDELLSDFDPDSAVLIVEGIRHVEAVNTLRDRLPDRLLLLVYLDIDKDQRLRRLQQRAESSHVLHHHVEQDVESLRAIANAVFPSSLPTADAVDLVKRYIAGVI